MSRQKRNLMICLAVIVVLGSAYFALMEQKESEKAPATESGAEGYITETTDFKAAELTVEADGEKESFVKDGTNWVMEGKEDIGLIQISIDQLIAYAKGLEYTQVVTENTDDLSVYGLENGNVIEVTGTDGTVIKLTVGDETVDGLGYYVMAEGQNIVYMVNSEAGKALKKGPSDFRDRYPEFVDYNNCKYITITKADGESYTLEQNPNGALTQGYGEYILKGVYSKSMPVETEKLSANIGGPIYEIAAVKFIDEPEDLSVYGLDNPRLIIDAEDMDGNKCTIEIGNDDTEVTSFAKFSGRDYVCTVSSAKVESVENTKMFDIIGKYFVTLSAADISKITIEENRGENRSLRAVFELDGSAGTVKYNGKEIPTEDFSNVFTNLSGLTIDGEATGEAGVIEAEIVIDKTNGESQTLRFHDYDNNYYAVEWDGATEFLMGRKTLDVLLGAIEKLQ